MFDVQTNCKLDRRRYFSGVTGNRKCAHSAVNLRFLKSYFPFILFHFYCLDKG